MRSPRQAFLSIAVALVSPGVDAFFAGVQVSSSRISRSLNTPVAPGDLAAVAKEMEDGSPAAAALPGEGSRGKLVLGSKSFTRKMIVEEMGFSPVVRSADIDEASIGDRTADPADLVMQLGLAKAGALLPTLKAEAERGELGSTLLLTGDQVVVHNGRVLEKPADEDEVRRNIAAYAESPCRTVGSAVITNILTGQQVSGVDSAEIFFSEIPEDVVTKLCSEGIVLQCAGGLMVEHVLVQPYITKIDGTIDSVMGLSKSLVDKLLEQIQQPS